MTPAMSPDEAAFLAAIKANPRDHLPRLVYADWLAEQGREHDEREQRFIVAEADALAAVLAAPDEDAPRLHYAEVMEAGAGEVGCGKCGGHGHTVEQSEVGQHYLQYKCPWCRDGRVSDGRRERGEFVRDCVWMAANHTDCPVRLADLKRGRPVPLRCGACEYCTRRRRAEQFYGGHSWLPGMNYAVAFEPTPLDGDVPTSAGGITAIVRRGFVDEVHATLAVLWGVVCERCNGVGLRAGSPPPGMEWGDPWCPACSGTGTTPGLLAAICASQPVTRCVATDRRPYAAAYREGEFVWFDAPIGAADSHLGAVLFAFLSGGRRPNSHAAYYPSRALAHDALSHALLAHARGLAGLGPIYGEGQRV